MASTLALEAALGRLQTRTGALLSLLETIHTLKYGKSHCYPAPRKQYPEGQPNCGDNPVRALVTKGEAYLMRTMDKCPITGNALLEIQKELGAVKRATAGIENLRQRRDDKDQQASRKWQRHRDFYFHQQQRLAAGERIARPLLLNCGKACGTKSFLCWDHKPGDDGWDHWSSFSAECWQCLDEPKLPAIRIDAWTVDVSNAPPKGGW